MNERAKVFAVAIGQMARPDAVAHIYDDGYVVAAPMDVDRQLLLFTQLKTLCAEVETSRSPVCTFAVVVLPDNIKGRPIPDDGPMLSASDQLYGSVVLPTENYHDHRQEDCDRINDALALFKHCLNDHDLPS